MAKFLTETQKMAQRFRPCIEMLSITGILLLSLSGCINDDNMCGDDMKTVDGEMYAMDKLCVPKDFNIDTEIHIDTNLPGPGDTGEPDADGGDDTDDDGCSSSADCSGGEYCDLTLNPPACLPPPTGQGIPCTSDADCSSFEADYCELWVSRTCLVKDCDPVANNCSEGWLCCDYADYGLPSLCVNSELAGGKCEAK